MRYSVEKTKEANDAKKLLFKTIDKMPRISEWFISLEGEGNSIGEPSLYIRLNGCYSAKCSWCDSKYSWFDGDKQDLDKVAKDILEEIKDKEIHRLTITGGEPLHYIEHLSKIVKWLKDNGLSFKFIGVESNGNLLKDKENVMKTLKEFNNIYRNFGTMPKLTISPKLDADACYGGALTDDEVISMYNTVIDNCMYYFDKTNIFFKFVWEIEEHPLMNKNNKLFIDILKKYGMARNHIMLMPWTPEDPKGKDKDIWKTSQLTASRMALNLGIKYSPRLHIDIEMD